MKDQNGGKIVHASERTENNEYKSNRNKVDTPIFKMREVSENSETLDHNFHQDFQRKEYEVPTKYVKQSPEQAAEADM